MSHSDRILEYLQTGRSITPNEADDLFACKRLGVRIYDLKQRGYPIISERVDGFTSSATSAIGRGTGW